MKQVKRILALTLAVMMLFGAAPISRQEVHAADMDENVETDITENAGNETDAAAGNNDDVNGIMNDDAQEAATSEEQNVPMPTSVVQNSYDKVTSVSAGSDCVIVYNASNKYYALAWNGSNFYAVEGSVSNNAFIPNKAIEEDNILWDYNAIRGFALASNSDVKVATSDGSSLTASGTYPFRINNSNRLRAINYANVSSWYLSYNVDTGWKVGTSSSDVSNFTFYQKVTKVNLTLNWYVDGTLVSGPTTSSVTAGKQTSISKPSEVSGMNFIKYEMNGQDYTSEISNITINEDTIINFYYTDPNQPDDILYPDDVTSGDEKPQYPDQGAVKVNKTATSDDFNGTGVAKVELGTTGVPMKKGVDVVIVLDVSTSMTDKGSTKLADAKVAACDFVDKVLGDNADGTQSNNRVGLVTFAGWNEGAGNKIEYPLKNANAKENIKTTINGLTTYSGTDYDYAFSGASTVLSQAAEGRDTFVVFMTDGAPSNYNGVEWTSNDPGTNLTNEANSKLLNNAETVKNASAVVYSIGFDMNFSGYNNGFTASEAQAILKKIATDEDHYVLADDSVELNKAFSDIATSIKKAGTNAVVTDQIGNLFELQTTQTLPNDKPALTFAPTIQVTLYDVYTRAEVGQTINGKEITLNDVGTRKGTSTVVETVTFSADGKSAFSNLKSGNIMDGSGNITAEKFTYNAATRTFTWTVGDITEQEATISYYVYLKGSMEGSRGDGLYDTNEYAKLNYTNYKDNQTEQEFTKPKMPWGAAVVNYEFYLVNEAGQPVNSRGDVIPFENRVKISDVKQEKFNWNNAANVEAKVEAAEFVPRGYTLHIEDAFYTANAVSSGNGSHTITGTVPEGAQQSTIMYQADAQYTNSYVAFGVLNRTTLIPDSVVLDYGKPVTIDVMANDMVMDAVLDSVAAGSTNIGVALGDGSTETLAEGFGNSVELTNGTAQLDGNGKVKYTPSKYMDSIDRFLYAAKVTTGSTVEGGADINYYRYQTVSVIPATTVYYEDNFGNTEDSDKTNGIVFSGKWTTEGTASATEQDNGTVSSDGHPYGNDSSYQNDNRLSAGLAHVISVDMGETATASFTFKGTGFDLISRTDTNSTKIAIKTVNSEDKNVQNKVLDLEYQSGTLYQIPVHEARFEKYDTYTVTITVAQATTEAEESATFYLDAIRIYNPIDPSGEYAEEANEHYTADKEANAVVTELRKLLLDQYSEGTLRGAIYVDCQNTESVATYENIGPNNEIYLKKGQSIGLAIQTSGDPASVQLGAKAVDGEVKFKVGSDTSSERELVLNTATDMYYDITNTLNFVVDNETNAKTANLVITNTSGADTIVSLTNLKVTYASDGITTAIITDEQVVANTFAVARSRMAVLEDDDEPETPPAEDPVTPTEKPIERFIKNLQSVIKNIFGRWF